MLQQPGRRGSGEEALQGRTSIQFLVVAQHALPIEPAIDRQEFERLGGSWLSESEVHLMGQMSSSSGFVQLGSPHSIHQQPGLLTGRHGSTQQSEEVVVASGGSGYM